MLVAALLPFHRTPIYICLYRSKAAVDTTSTYENTGTPKDGLAGLRQKWPLRSTEIPDVLQFSTAFIEASRRKALYA